MLFMHGLRFFLCSHSKGYRKLLEFGDARGLVPLAISVMHVTQIERQPIHMYVLSDQWKIACP